MGEYASLSWGRMYYEVWGEGKPALLMHGGACTVETLHPIAALLAKRRRLVLPERRGHGRTPDVEGPFTYETMARDTVEFIESLGLQGCDAVGYSDGANAALVSALNHPGMIGRLVLISGNLNTGGLTEAGLDFFRNATPEVFEGHPGLSKLVQLYRKTSPDGPDHFPVVLGKLRRMWCEEPSIAKEELGKLDNPTLIMVGDRDVIRLDHALEMYRSMPNSQLSVVPGASHMLIFEKSERVSQLIIDFLEAGEGV